MAKMQELFEKMTSRHEPTRTYVKETRRESAKKDEKSAQSVVTIQKPPTTQVPSSFKEVFPLIEPYAYSAITHDPATGGMLYFVIEPTLLEQDAAYYRKIRGLLIEELDVDLRKITSTEQAQKLLKSKVDDIVKTYKIKIEAETLEKLMYFLMRDFIHLGRIEPLMRDHMIEDVSCDGPNVPIYIWHRKYESIPTNVVFEESQGTRQFRGQTCIPEWKTHLDIFTDGRWRTGGRKPRPTYLFERGDSTREHVFH